jgi:hypothetical protein
VDLNRLERTNGNFVGISWEKLGTFRFGNEGVTILFGNFVGITWEKLGKKSAFLNQMLNLS